MKIIGKLSIGIWFLALLLTVTGCSVFATPTPEVVIEVVKETVIMTQEVIKEVEVLVEQTVIVTATPEPATSTPEPDFIFTDDFSDEDSGWSINSSETSAKFYEDGMFHIEVQDGFTSWSTNPLLQSLDDFVIDVDTRLIEGGENGYIGIMFRYQDKDNYYRFMISNGGYSFLLQERNGEIDALAISSEVDHVNKNSAGNHIQIIADGSKLSAYVNGELTVLIYDDTFRRGDINLFASSTGEHIEAAFDNLVVAEIK